MNTEIKNLKATLAEYEKLLLIAANNAHDEHEGEESFERLIKRTIAKHKKAPESTPERGVIPKKFYKGDNHPSARTVGQIKAILAELPDDLRVEADWGAAVQVVVYNHGAPDMHVQFEEHEDEDEG